MFFRRVLEVPVIYDTFQFFCGIKKLHRIIKDEYIGNVQGCCVLELGCGTADILELFEQCEYTGVDIDENYINHAKKRWSHNKWTQFICQDVNSYISNCHKKYDLILMTAMIHHISDDEVEHAFKGLTRMLKEEGRFISYDPVYVKNMNCFERFIADHDRGQFVRTEDEYAEIAKKYWDNVSWICRKDLVYVPSNIIIFSNTMNLQDK